MNKKGLELRRHWRREEGGERRGEVSQRIMRCIVELVGSMDSTDVNNFSIRASTTCTDGKAGARETPSPKVNRSLLRESSWDDAELIQSRAVAY